MDLWRVPWDFRVYRGKGQPSAQLVLRWTFMPIVVTRKMPLSEDDAALSGGIYAKTVEGLERAVTVPRLITTD